MSTESLSCRFSSEERKSRPRAEIRAARPPIRIVTAPTAIRIAVRVKAALESDLMGLPVVASISGTNPNFCLFCRCCWWCACLCRF